MKVLTKTFLFLSLPLPTLAQPSMDSLSNNQMNQTKSLYICEGSTASLANETGNNSVWDFSGTVGSGGTRTISIINPSASSYGSEYAGYSNYAMEVESSFTTFNTRNISGNEEFGYVLPNTDLGDIKAKFFTNSWSQMDYPFSFGTNNVDNYTGTISFTLNGTTQNPSCYGNGYVHYDGFGKLIQANGDTLNNVARLKLLDTTYTSVPIFGQIRLIREQYQYYAMDSIGELPVFMHAHAYVLSSLPNPLIDMTYVLSEAQPSLTASLNENPSTSNKPLIYPNPSNGTVHIRQMGMNKTFTVYTMDGKLVHTGVGNKEVDIHLDNGVYLVQIEGNQQRFTEKIIVRK